MVDWIAEQVRSAFGAPLYLPLVLAAVGVLAAGVAVSSGAVRRRLGDAGHAFASGFLAAVLAVLAVLSVENYVKTDYFRYGSHLNAYEFFHYYLGSKYAPELGYTRLYAAALIADDETGRKWDHPSKMIRNLETGGYVAADTVLADRETVKARFSPERWEAFKGDVAWFKDDSRLNGARWASVLRDKGYNGTPVWGMVVGGLLANRVPTSSARGMGALSLLDPLLLAAAMGLVWWAFGFRAMALLVVLLGTNYMMKWWHMKGAFLRTDWVAAMVASVCLMKKGRHGLAGGLLAWSVLSRIFPAVLLFGPGVKLAEQAWDFRRQRSGPLFEAAARRFPGRRGAVLRLTAGAAVFLAAVCVLFWVRGALVPFLAAPERDAAALFRPAGAGTAAAAANGVAVLVLAALGATLGMTAVQGWWTGGMDRRWLRFFAVFAVVAAGFGLASAAHWRGTGLWPEYVKKIGDHNQGVSEWRVGYKYILMAEWPEGFSALDTPPRQWTPQLRSARYQERLHSWWDTQATVLLAAFLAAFFLKDHRALMLGFAPLFFLSAATYYYYIMLLVPMLFFAERAESPPHALGASLLLLSGASGYLFYGLWRQQYGTYYWLSVELMAVCLLLLALGFAEGLLSAWGPRDPDTARGDA